MKSNIKIRFKYVYIVGWLFLFISVFLEWYVFQVYSGRNNLVASWSYNPVTEWTSVISSRNSRNSRMKPSDLAVPLPITVLFIGVLFGSGYAVLFKDIETQELNNLHPYVWTNMFLLVLNGFFIFAFPVFYLLPHKLYFPYLLIKDRDSGLTYFYSIGPGYFLQILGFVLIFPYSLHYYQTVSKFESQAHTPENMVANYLRQIQEPLDLDQLIAKEQINLKFENSNLEEQQPLSYNKKRRGRERRSMQL
jgi:hypothetical protein